MEINRVVLLLNSILKNHSWVANHTIIKAHLRHEINYLKGDTNIFLRDHLIIIDKDMNHNSISKWRDKNINKDSNNHHINKNNINMEVYINLLIRDKIEGNHQDQNLRIPLLIILQFNNVNIKGVFLLSIKRSKKDFKIIHN